MEEDSDLALDDPCAVTPQVFLERCRETRWAVPTPTPNCQKAKPQRGPFRCILYYMNSCFDGTRRHHILNPATGFSPFFRLNGTQPRVANMLVRRLSATGGGEGRHSLIAPG
jgi:hypothetical protein